jgi:hypothetical protein
MISEELIRQVAEQVAEQVALRLGRLGRLGAPVLNPEKAQPPLTEPLEPRDFEAPWTGEIWPSSHVLPVPAQPRSPASHSSEDQFEIDEAVETTAAVHELVEFFESKRCTIEDDKACDHCGACRRLGF